MKRHERLMLAIEMYQARTNAVHLVCRDDGTKLIGRCHLGHVYLECQVCGLRRYEIPSHLLQQYMCAKDSPTSWQISEAHELATELERSVPVEVLHSAMKLQNYINSIKGQLVEKRGLNGKTA